MLAATVVKSTVVLKVDFPEPLESAAVKTVEPEVIFSEMLANASSYTVGDTFHIKATLVDTHTFVFEVRVVWFTEHRGIQADQ